MGIKHSFHVHLISEACTWHAHVEDKNVQSKKSRNQGKHIDRYGTSHIKAILITIIILLELHEIFAIISLSISNDDLD